LTIKNSCSSHHRLGFRPGVSTYKIVQICGATSKNLGKVKEKDGNKVAQGAGYIDAHDAKDGRGEGGVDIYRDKETKQYWLWNGVKGAEKEPL
jgi:hypothetical protein